MIRCMFMVIGRIMIAIRIVAGGRVTVMVINV